MGATGGLLGREGEHQQLTSLLRGARNGHGGSVLVVGDPGIGKSALLDTTIDEAPPASVLRVDGFESESALPFAAVGRLVVPLLDQLPGVQPRQREAIRVASGLAEGAPPDRFLVGLGVLNLLAASATARPVVCAVDDAHLLDPESLDVLAFVARRVEVEPVVLLFAGRDEQGLADRLGGVPVLSLTGLDIEPALALLRASAPAIDPASAAAIVRATGGNPLALIDLARDVSVDDLTVLGIGEAPVPIGRHLEAHYLRRVRRADRAVQDWVLLAAADTTDSVDLVAAAAAELGLREEALDRAELGGLVHVDELVQFRHPLVRSAVYNGSPGTDRRRIHRALAAAAQRLGLVETEAWHASRAVVGTDAEVAARLQHAADLAARRGGFASRASILGRAAELTPPGPVREARSVDAAEAALAVGVARVATSLLGRLDDQSVDAVVRGRSIVVRTQVGVFTPLPGASATGSARLLEAAGLFHGLDPEREQRTLLQAFDLCTVADRWMEGVTQQELGERLAAGSQVASGPLSVILRGLSALVLLPYDEAVPLARAALDEVMGLPDHAIMQLGTSVAVLGTFLWATADRDAVLDRAAGAARDAGALQQLDSLLWIMSLSQLDGGTVNRAIGHIESVREVRRAMGYDAEHVINAALMAWTGAPVNAVLAVAEGTKAAGFGGVYGFAVAALAATEVGRGAYRDAYQRLTPLIEQPFLHVTATHYPDYVEAALRSGHPDQATRYAQRLMALARVNGSPFCLGLAERCLGLVAADATAEEHFRTAITHLATTQAEVDLGRAHLLYGEWLRRRRRRREATEQLNRARQLLQHSGADVFLPRTEAELQAAGAKPTGTRDPDPVHDLTAQQAQIARLAATGHTNPEIAANLFISPNTVDYHLRKVFQRLGISSRRQLADRLQGSEGRPPA